MLVLIGYVVVLGSVFGGYALMGGHFGALYQPLELLMIGGAAFGAFLAGNNRKTILATVKELLRVLRSSRHNKALYMDLLALLFLLLAKGRKDGMLALESEIENPANSALFQQYPRIQDEPGVVDFLCDYLRVIISGNANPFEVEALMDHEIETYRHEASVPAQALARVGDALPALGIVAAVLGVVNALASADQPPSVMGQMIAHAMVGTFLGVLLAYGFITPLSSLIEQKLAESAKMYEAIKVTLLASLNGYAPQLAVEFGRKVLYSTERPSFGELDAHVREVKAR
ncbi:flagellar motor stator protein MotA [Ramlibacter tataouinensis]|uniref:flagellar motor stator protein MotA n=1 Tax=Ramlibacter tataouinensis TaxID=94132 RepID=UPI0022F38F3D|nr:flagellar motor stator protein MotA [Ramlibacter tataouinensis]WBY00628.1 flagellar motor stator protein MotA [Ramlibacter tataouinensis]